MGWHVAASPSQLQTHTSLRRVFRTKLATNSQHAHCVGIVQPAKQKQHTTEAAAAKAQRLTLCDKTAIQPPSSGLKSMRSSVADTNGGNLNLAKDSTLKCAKDAAFFCRVQQRLV